MNEVQKPFAGITIVELASVLAGPSVGTFFAELGARVIKVENPNTGGDPTRKWKSEKEQSETNISAYYASANWGKEVLYLDLKNTTDYQEVTRLIKTSDILLINFKPGDEQKFGLDYESLKIEFPALIVGQITGFPNDNRPAFDIVLQAETGLMSLNGQEGSSGLKWPLPIVDILAAHQLKEGILTALYQRQKTGQGALVSVALYDAAIGALFNVGTNVLMGGADPRSLGELHPNIAPYGETLTTSDDRRIVLAVGTDRQFATLCTILGADPSLANDFSTNHLRVRNRKQLREELQKLAGNFKFDDLCRALTTENVPFGRVKTIKSVLSELSEKYFLREKTSNVNTVRLRTAVFTIRS